jgi:zinc transporter ZupT
MIYLFVLFITVIICGSSILYFKPKGKFLKFLLAFSGSFLIGITFMNLVPEVFQKSLPYTGVFIVIGFVIQLVLELITEGAEHGHEHIHSEGEKISPFLLLFGLCIHSFLEGLPILSSFMFNIKNSLVLGIVVHNIPISLTLMALFLHYGLSKRKAFLYLFIFALMTPFGSLVGKYIMSTITVSLETFFIYTMALVIGIFLHVSTSILFESGENHKYNIQKFSTVIMGLIIAFGVTLLN